MSDDRVPSLIGPWERALADANSALETLRSIYPSRMMLLPETGHRAVASAMSNAQSAVSDLHRAGRYVLGVDGYEDFLAHQVADDLQI